MFHSFPVCSLSSICNSSTAIQCPTSFQLSLHLSWWHLKQCFGLPSHMANSLIYTKCNLFNLIKPSIVLFSFKSSSNSILRGSRIQCEKLQKRENKKSKRTPFSDFLMSCQRIQKNKIPKVLEMTANPLAQFSFVFNFLLWNFPFAVLSSLDTKNKCSDFLLQH